MSGPSQRRCCLATPSRGGRPSATTERSARRRRASRPRSGCWPSPRRRAARPARDRRPAAGRDRRRRLRAREVCSGVAGVARRPGRAGSARRARASHPARRAPATLRQRPLERRVVGDVEQHVHDRDQVVRASSGRPGPGAPMSAATNRSPRVAELGVRGDRPRPGRGRSRRPVARPGRARREPSSPFRRRRRRPLDAIEHAMATREPADPALEGPVQPRVEVGRQPGLADARQVAAGVQSRPLGAGVVWHGTHGRHTARGLTVGLSPRSASQRSASQRSEPGASSIRRRGQARDESGRRCVDRDDLHRPPEEAPTARCREHSGSQLLISRRRGPVRRAPKPGKRATTPRTGPARGDRGRLVKPYCRGRGGRPVGRDPDRERGNDEHEPASEVCREFGYHGQGVIPACRHENAGHVGRST